MGLDSISDKESYGWMKSSQPTWFFIRKWNDWNNVFNNMFPTYVWKFEVSGDLGNQSGLFGFVLPVCKYWQCGWNTCIVSWG